MLDIPALVRFYDRELTNVSKSDARPPVHSASTLDRVRKGLGITYVKHFSYNPNEANRDRPSKWLKVKD